MTKKERLAEWKQCEADLAERKRQEEAQREARRQQCEYLRGLGMQSPHPEMREAAAATDCSHEGAQP